MIDFLKNQGAKKPNTDRFHTNEPKFGHTYSVFSLVLEVYKEM